MPCSNTLLHDQPFMQMNCSVMYTAPLFRVSNEWLTLIINIYFFITTFPFTSETSNVPTIPNSVLKLNIPFSVSTLTACSFSLSPCTGCRVSWSRTSFKESLYSHIADYLLSSLFIQDFFIFLNVSNFIISSILLYDSLI